MKSQTDYNFFDDSLRTIRKLQGSHYPIFQGSLEIRGENSPSPPARIIREEVGIADCIFEATSYATMPGHGLSRLQELVRYPLPPEFIAFYEKYEKALAVTLTSPLYFWSEDKIIEEINDRRDFLDRPMRTFRFGEEYDREAAQYGLWLEEPGTMKWQVIVMDAGVIDEDADAYVPPYRRTGASFYEWFREWMKTDGAFDFSKDWVFFKAVP